MQLKRKILKFKKLHPDAILPSYQCDGDSGFDFHAILDEENPCYFDGSLKIMGDSYENGEPGLWVKPKSQCVVQTGLAPEIPEGYEIQVRPRSGLAFKKSITIVNSPGTIDQSYSGPIKIILFNLGNTPFFIKKGDRISQGVMQKVEQFEIMETHALRETERAAAGFGSTGV